MVTLRPLTELLRPRTIPGNFWSALIAFPQTSSLATTGFLMSTDEYTRALDRIPRPEISVATIQRSIRRQGRLPIPDSESNEPRLPTSPGFSTTRNGSRTEPDALRCHYQSRIRLRYFPGHGTTESSQTTLLRPWPRAQS